MTSSRQPGMIAQRLARGLTSFFTRDSGADAAAGDLTGKVVVVTGAARGLGAEVARNLAGRGARLALLGLEPRELAEVAVSCGESAAWWEVDVTDGDELAKVALGVVEHFGSVDVVVVNAGIAGGGPLELSDPAAYDRIIEVNLFGSVRTARAFLPYLLASGGYLLQIASLAAIMHGPMMGAYCASKAGAEAFADCLRAETAHRGVEVGVAYLSWVDTEMVRGADAIEGLRQLRAALPPPLNKVYPLDAAAERLVEGITRRAARIYVPKYVSALMASRATSPTTVQLLGRRGIGAAEEAIRASGSQATLPVGAGGAADTYERSARR